LSSLALEPSFEAERERALSRALKPYVDYETRFGLTPTPEEVALANLYLFADYQPEGGEPPLVEQVRTMISEHVPEEERAWLDPLRHSFMDVLEVLSVAKEGILELRSLGSGKTVQVEAGEVAHRVRPGQVVLTRILRLGDQAVMPGPAVVLSSAAGQALFDKVTQWRQTVEARTGAFDLAEWEEFAKRYGSILLWGLALVRLEALIRAEAAIRYRTPAGEPFLYAVALYEHQEASTLREGLSTLEGWHPSADQAAPGAMWVQQESRAGEDQPIVVARLTLTPTQLFVECDSSARLDRVKHQLASTFGFALHFRGESTRVPSHELPHVNLEDDEPVPLTVVVHPEEELALLAPFLESVYLEWADRPSPALCGETPRHAANTAEGRAKVAALIDALEREDLAARRTGKPGYDYGRLRAQVGL
jgi:hypothetical protein